MSKRYLRVTRTIVVEGEADWVLATLRELHALVPQSGDRYLPPCHRGVVLCASREDASLDTPIDYEPREL